MRSEVDHRVDGVIVKDLLDREAVRRIAVDDGEIRRRQRSQNIDNASMSVGEVVEHHGVVACCIQRRHRMASDISGAAGDQCRHRVIIE